VLELGATDRVCILSAYIPFFLDHHDTPVNVLRLPYDRWNMNGQERELAEIFHDASSAMSEMPGRTLLWRMQVRHGRTGS
jgi:hypothetical protein